MASSRDVTGVGRAGRITLADRLEMTAGKPAGFDYLRVALAFSVFLWHCFLFSYPLTFAVDLANSPWRPLVGFVLPMFFSLSGFLVAGSLDRSKTLVNFLGLRVIRIFPALAVEVTLSALILGPIFTVLPLREYFSSASFHSYFLNIAGDIHYLLPGVFEHNPNSNMVNPQLWTVPFEMKCYVYLALLAVIAVARRRLVMAIVVIGAQTAYALHYGMTIHWTTRFFMNNVGGGTLVFSFLTGVVLYSYRDKVRWSHGGAIACFVMSWILLLSPYGQNLVSLPLTYLTAYLGLQNPRRNRLVSSGDYSYGIFLFGAPMQQVVLSLGGWTHHWYMVLILALAPCGLFAAASWHFVEKHALKLKSVVRYVEAKYINARTAALAALDLPGRLSLVGSEGFGKRLRSRRPPLD